MKSITPRTMASLLALTLSYAGHSNAESNLQNKFNTLRNEFEQKLEALKQDYEARLLALEARQTRQSPPPQHTHHPEHAPHPAQENPVANNDFNPEISLVLQGAWLKQKAPTERPVTGFLMPLTEPETRGFTLGGTELLMSAPVGPYFQGHVNFSVADDSVEVEEAWVRAQTEDKQLLFKGGRFLSAVSHANEQHAHTQDFYGPALMHQVLFGEHLVQDGFQFRGHPLRDTRLELGLEMARGQVFPGAPDAGNRNGFGTWAAFARTGGQIGKTQEWRAGLAYLAARPQTRETRLDDFPGLGETASFSGNSRTWIADFGWQWASENAPHKTRLQFQGEIFRRSEQGTMRCAGAPAGEGICLANAGSDFMENSFRARQSGGYWQAVYPFMPRWRAGYRYDRLNPGQLNFAPLSTAASAYRPRKHSLMVDYSPGEASRLRLQFAQDQSRQGITDHQLALQYVFILGAHRSHEHAEDHAHAEHDEH